MNFVEEWKEKEIKSILEGAEEYKYKLNYLKELETKSTEELDKAKRAYKSRIGKEAKLIKLTPVTKGYEDEKLNKLYKIKENDKDNYWKYKYSNKLYMDYAWNLIKLKEKAIKLVDKHFNTLQKKVEKKIGTIIKISHIDGDDYRFEGTEGNCKVEVILAGGYNIQRLHTRWIIKNK